MILFAQQNLAADAESLTIEIRDGATVIRQEVLSPGTSIAESSFTLTTPERDAITSWPPSVAVIKVGAQMRVMELWRTNPNTTAGAIDLPTDVGTYAITGSPADLLKLGAFALSTEAGGYVLTGSDAAFTRAYVVDLTPGSYAVTGSPADLATLHALTLTTVPGVYTLNGAAALGLVARVCAAASGAYTVTGTDVELATARGLLAEAGPYVITGLPAGTSYSGQAAYTIIRIAAARSAAGGVRAVRSRIGGLGAVRSRIGGLGAVRSGYDS